MPWQAIDKKQELSNTVCGNNKLYGSNHIMKKEKRHLQTIFSALFPIGKDQQQPNCPLL